jgi:8-oxo-dGTP pyrophosphatase MutT (NUDIX family)
VKRPVSIKGVCALSDGRVLLCGRYGGGWELPGGRPEPDEPHEECLVRELWEETGLAVRVGRPLGTIAFEVVPERWVDIVGYLCVPGSAVDADSLVVSDEHTQVAFVDVDTLESHELPAVYRRLISRARPRAA